jgi:transposase
MYAIGVDYHKASSHLTVLDSTRRAVRAGRIANTAAEVRKLVAPFGNEAEAALEATRNWTVKYDLLEAEVRAVHLVHPLKVRAIAEARVKTDRIDSGILAHLLRCDLLPTPYVRPPAQRATQQLLRQRVFFVRVRMMVKNRIHVLIDRQRGIREVATEFSDLFGQAGLAWLRTVALPGPERALLDRDLQLFDELHARVTETDRAVRQLVAHDPAMQQVRTVPGFGRFFAALVVTEIGTIARFRSPEKLRGFASGASACWVHAVQSVDRASCRRSAVSRRSDSCWRSNSESRACVYQETSTSDPDLQYRIPTWSNSWRKPRRSRPSRGLARAAPADCLS